MFGISVADCNVELSPVDWPSDLPPDLHCTPPSTPVISWRKQNLKHYQPRKSKQVPRQQSRTIVAVEPSSPFNWCFCIENPIQEIHRPEVDDDEASNSSSSLLIYSPETVEFDLRTMNKSTAHSTISKRSTYTYSHVVDPYQLLQIRRDATPSEIRQAFKHLSLWHHPGRGLKASLEERARRRQIFEVLAACYETLSDKETRKRCDVLLKELAVATAAEGSKKSDGKQKTTKSGRRIIIGRIKRQQSQNSDRNLMPTLSVASSQSSSSIDSCPTSLTTSSSPLLSNPDTNAVSQGEHGDLKVLSSVHQSSIDEGSITTTGSTDEANNELVTTENAEDEKSSAESNSGISCHSHPSVQEQREALFNSSCNAVAMGNTNEEDQASSAFQSLLQCVVHSIGSSDSSDDGQNIPITILSGDSYRNPAGDSKSLASSRKGNRVRYAAHVEKQPDTIPPLVNSSSSDRAESHYSERETSRLFGGPLQLLFRARRWKPFQDPFKVFAHVFHSSVHLGGIPPKHLLIEGQQSATLPTQTKPSSSLPTYPTTMRSSTSSWMGSSERKKDCVICTTSRTLHDRILTRTETIRLVKGKRVSTITVTSEPIPNETEETKEDDHIAKVQCSELECFQQLWCMQAESQVAISEGEIETTALPFFCNAWMPECT